jgi:hypothetical protein
MGIDRNKFNKLVRPHLTEIPLGKQAIAFDTIEINSWIDDYISCNGRRLKVSKLENDVCINAIKCQGYASGVKPGTLKNAVNMPKAAGSTRAREKLAALKQKNI